MTPLLIFVGIPPAVAVASEATQITGSSISGMLAHWRRGNVDVRMGLALLLGGILGSGFGVWLFTYLRGLGQLDLVIKLSYVVFLGIIGVLMLIESVKAILKRKQQATAGRRHHTWVHGLPLKMRFRKSRLYISAIPPVAIGLLVGLLAAIMGVGGGFIMVPAMIYLLGMPTAVVVGTSLFQIIFVTANVTILQSATNQTVDIVLGLLLLIGGVIGAQLGARFSNRLHGEQLRVLLALLVLGVCVKLTYDLLAIPTDLFSLGAMVRH
jgi:uncharacterized membrane protein YfcA